MQREKGKADIILLSLLASREFQYCKDRERNIFRCKTSYTSRVTRHSPSLRTL